MTTKPLTPAGPYVYALVDPDGAVFYIGKGRGLRMYQHVKDALKGEVGTKCDRIRAILDDGGDVEHRVIGEYAADDEAYADEIRYIAAFDDLTNILAGGGGMPISYKERCRRRAELMLRQLRPTDVVVAGMGVAARKVLASVCGTPEAFVDRFREELEKEAIEPAPNVIYINRDGTHTFGWERP